MLRSEMICCRRLSIAFVCALTMLGDAVVRAQIPVPLSDNVSDLAGEWKRDPRRGTGGICGVVEDETITFAFTEPRSVSIRSRYFTGNVPLDGSSASIGSGRTIVASTDAGWLKLSITTARDGGFANVMQEVFILNRDRRELTLWRTLNTVLPDGSSGKIDCGNRAASIYLRQ